MEKAFQGTYRFASVIMSESFPDTPHRTPYGLDVSLPNKERGTFHIEKGNYWKFYNLEYAKLRPDHLSMVDFDVD